MCCVCLLLLSAPWKTVKPMSDVPRLARSVDDLRVGQVVVQRILGRWMPPFMVAPDDIDDKIWMAKNFDRSPIVILSDPPDPPARYWLIPETKMEALGEAMDDIPQEPESHVGLYPTLYWAARAVLDAAREVEHE